MISLALAFLWAGSADPAASLMRVLEKVRADLRRMPNYTCVETLTREFYRPIAPVKRSCEVLLPMKQAPTLDMKLLPWYTDRLRLEVGLSQKGEIRAWAGASQFEDTAIDRVVPNGPAGTGMFGSFLGSIFDQDVRAFQFLRELTVDGRLRLKYAFSVPESDSNYKVKIGNSWATTAYHGTIEVDPETSEVTRIQVQTAILPPAAGTCQTTSDLSIAATPIGDWSFPLTVAARQHFVASDGGEAVNTTKFSNCREYRGDSTVRFGTEENRTGGPTGRAVPAAPKPIPGGLTFSLRLIGAIDGSTAAAGDRFTARLGSSIREFGHTFAPAGAKVEGRLLRVQQYHGKNGELVVVLRPEWVEVRGVRIPLAARQDILTTNKKQPGVEILLPFAWETNAALVRAAGGLGVRVPDRWETHWRTVVR